MYDIEIQAVAKIQVIDMVEAISKLEDFEISDIFQQVAEKMDSKEAIKLCAARLINHCKIRFGGY